jgi:hypothetical protein
MQNMHMLHTTSSPLIRNRIVESGLSKTQNMCMCLVTLLDCFILKHVCNGSFKYMHMSLHLVLQRGYIIFFKI